MIITIDGPTASGKSTIASLLAQKLRLCHINSGLLYRSLAYLLVTKAGYSAAMLNAITAEDIATYLDAARLKYYCETGTAVRITFDGSDITPYLKKNDIDLCAAQVAKDPRVRRAITAIQRGLAYAHDVVVDGRDAGSVVFPDADVKFFLTAPLAVRAQRWCDELRRKGMPCEFEQVVRHVQERDTKDEERVHGRLVVPEGAHVIDNAGMSVEQTLAVFLDYIQNRGAL